MAGKWAWHQMLPAIIVSVEDYTRLKPHTTRRASRIFFLNIKLDIHVKKMDLFESVAFYIRFIDDIILLF
jgi:hypothetical protein